MKDVAELLNAMRDQGVIEEYALFGAIAQMRYTEPVTTLDADVLVSVPSPERLDVLKPIYEFCAGRGYLPERDSVRVGAWPVQFFPVFSELTSEALAQADVADFDGTPLRVVGPDYLALIALGTGRAKDLTRILALLESGSVRRDEMARLARQHGLDEAWKRFEAKFLNE